MNQPSLRKLFENVEAAVRKDLTADRNEFAFRMPPVERWLGHAVCDQRDIPVLRVWLNIMTITVPSAVTVYATASHLWGLAYLILNYALFLQRFLVALLHVSEHRRLFKKGDA